MPNPASRKSAAEAHSAAQAASVAASVASEAAHVARDVAQRATETASNVAALAAKTSESVVLLGHDITYIKGDLSEIKQKLEKVYVTQDQFAPVRFLVFGMTGCMLLAIIGAIMTTVLRK